MKIGTLAQFTCNIKGVSHHSAKLLDDVDKAVCHIVILSLLKRPVNRD